MPLELPFPMIFIFFSEHNFNSSSVFFNPFEFGSTLVAAAYVIFSIDFKSTFLIPVASSNGNPAIVCIRIGTLANLAAIILTIPALGV